MRIKSVVYIVALTLCCSVTYGVTLTFDEVPSGTVLATTAYASARVWFTLDFRATDHAGSPWGPPYSGSNVVTSVGTSFGNPHIGFGYFDDSVFDPDLVQSVSAYFSTNVGVMVRVTAYRWGNPSAVTSVVIGASGESWNNRYVEISSTPELPFERLEFEAVNSPDDLLGFSADDMTILPAPEPSSLAALALGLLPLGAALARRRKR
ncbi:MAG: PEP-CTERM sorting domain-containing protein [Armatimonadota bacterium]|nr:PEP-CTERM sorting domain-containing protein [Armatimonadota bacterium]